MKKLIFSVALLSAALSASAEDHPLGCATQPSHPMALPSPSLIKATSTVFLSTAVKHDSSQPMLPSIHIPYGALTARKLPFSLTAKEVSTSS